MIIYSKENYVQAQGFNGYDKYTRDTICSNCHTSLGEQVKYIDISKEFRYENKNQNSWEFCPFCSEKLF